MNKLFSKIATFSVGLAMAIGVGVAVGSKGVVRAKAAEDDTHDYAQTTSVVLNNGAAIADIVIEDPGFTIKSVNVEWNYNKNIDAVDAVVSVGSEEIGSFNVSSKATQTEEIACDNLSGDVVISFTNKCTASSGCGTFKVNKVTLVEGGEAVDHGELVSLAVTGSMTKTSYTTADAAWDPSGFVVTGTYQDDYQKEVTSSVNWSYDHPVPAEGVTSLIATATIGEISADSAAQAVTVEVVVPPITLNSSNWPVTATSTHSDVQTSVLDGITYENKGGYIYGGKLSLNYATNNYFGNRTAFPRNIKSIVVTYVTDVTSYVKMYEGSEPLSKDTLVASSGTTSVTYTFSDSNPYFRLNMTNSTPKGTYCNITSIVITLGSAADKVNLEDISVNGNKTLPVGVTFTSQLTLDPANANNKDTIAWSSSNTSVATVNANGVVTTVGAGQATITATATDLVGVSASYVVTVFATSNTIEKIYYMENGSALDFNGIYVGFITGSGPVVMNGEYGVLLYKSSMDCSGYTEGVTILNVKGTLSIYSGLYEVVNPTVEVLESASDVSEPVTYAVTGSETYIHESRRTYVSGTVTSVSGNWTSDTTIMMDVNGHSIQCFAKGGSITDTSVQEQIVAEASITLKGFSGWHNGFQVTVIGLVEAVETYTAEDFAQDLLSQTNAVCVNYVDGESSYDEFKSEFQSIWNDLSSADKYQALPSDQKTILEEADRNESGTVVEQAMARYDFLVGKYKLDNFITGRTPMVLKPEIEFSANDTSSMTLIVVAIATTSAIALGALLILKKKKHQ